MDSEATITTSTAQTADRDRDLYWRGAREELDGLGADNGLNIAYEAVDRHVHRGDGEVVALRWIPTAGDPKDITYAELMVATSRFANAVRAWAAGRTVKLASLSGRVPELYVAALGTLKAGGVFTPLFSAFGPEPIKQRIDLGGIEVLVTTQRLYERRVEPIRGDLASLKLVILTDASSSGEGTVGFADFVEGQPGEFAIAPTPEDQLALLHFTSGTTGLPKGVMHVHGAVLAHHATGGTALGLERGDIYWCTADPGWVTGTSYGIISPLTHRVTSIIDEGTFDADRWYRIIQEHHVSVWYTAPTAIRMLMRAGAAVAHAYDLSSLRVIASVGEPLNPEAVRWGLEAFGQPILDNWWQTETGGIMIANRPGDDVRPGSMGHPLPGIEATIVRREGDAVCVDAAGEPVHVTDPDEAGELALRRGWPSMFRGYLDLPERTARAFVGDWYLSGDLARRDADGYFWFVGRGDDMIKSSGHFIGPFEVESALIEHPAVAEAAAIGKPDEVAGDIVKAFVLLAPGVEPSDELERSIVGHARARLGPAVAPREIEFVETIPKTRSGKIMRRLLRARELGLPEGDTSTLEQ